jgi:hypothetical protein
MVGFGRYFGDGGYFDPVAVALIVSDSDGGLALFGSKNLRHAHLEITADVRDDWIKRS